MTICSRCHGTILAYPGWQVLFRMASALHAWHAVSPHLDGSGGFLSRWDHRLQRPSIRAGLRARHPILYASFDESWKSCRRRPHLYDGVLRRPGFFAGRLHQYQSLGVTLHRQSVSPSLRTQSQHMVDTSSDVRRLAFEVCPYWEHPSLEETPERNE